MVSYRDVPMTNRPNKKVYHITAAGEQELQAWLEAPVVSSLDLKPFLLKMAFSPLMGKATILAHIDRAIAQLEVSSQDQDHGIRLEMDYLDKETLNQHKARVLWNGIYTLLTRTARPAGGPNEGVAPYCGKRIEGV